MCGTRNYSVQQHPVTLTCVLINQLIDWLIIIYNNTLIHFHPNANNKLNNPLTCLLTYLPNESSQTNKQKQKYLWSGPSSEPELRDILATAASRSLANSLSSSETARLKYWRWFCSTRLRNFPAGEFGSSGVFSGLLLNSQGLGPALACTTTPLRRSLRRPKLLLLGGKERGPLGLEGGRNGSVLAGPWRERLWSINCVRRRESKNFVWRVREAIGFVLRWDEILI